MSWSCCCGWKSFEHVVVRQRETAKGTVMLVSVACTYTCHGTWVMVISAYIQIDDLSVEPYTQYMLLSQRVSELSGV